MRNHSARLQAWIVCLTLTVLASGCLVIDNTYPALPPGPWRGILKLENNTVNPNPKGEPLPDKVDLQFEEVTEGQLPFNFEVTYASADSFTVTLINGEERIVLDEVTYGRNRATGDDTIRIDMPVFDSFIRGKFAGNVIEGEWVATNRGDYRIPFVAYYGKNHRFTELKKEPVADLSGRWEAQFEIETDNPYPAIANFTQQGNELRGTFLTESGDYRFLEGTVQGDKMYLSAFDGSHAFLFEAKLLEDGRLIGSFLSGKHYRTVWEAKRNSEAKLKDTGILTQMKPEFDRFRVAFTDEKGNMVDTDQPPYAGKPMFVQVLGTWCPNCRDEVEWLVDWLSENPDWQGEGLALAFERHEDPKRAWNAINTMRKKLDIPYQVLLAGNSSKESASQALPMLNGISAFPTLILLNKDHQVEYIATGITGPATREFETFKADLAARMEKLIEPAQ